MALGMSIKICIWCEMLTNLSLNKTLIIGSNYCMRVFPEFAYHRILFPMSLNYIQPIKDSYGSIQPICWCSLRRWRKDIHFLETIFQLRIFIWHNIQIQIYPVLIKIYIPYKVKIMSIIVYFFIFLALYFTGILLKRIELNQYIKYYLTLPCLQTILSLFFGIPILHILYFINLKSKKKNTLTIELLICKY